MTANPGGEPAEVPAGSGGARWFKSSASSVTGCVEVAYLAGGLVAVRDSRDPSAAPPVLTRRTWDGFLAGVKRGEFDLPPR